MQREQDPFDFQSDSLETLAERLNDMLGRPVTIEDSNHRLIAYSSHEPETDPARLATIIGRRVPDHVLGILWRDGVLHQLQESSEPLRIPAIEDAGLKERVAIAISSPGGTLGYIWVVENEKPFSLDETALLKQAALAVKAKLVNTQHLRQKNQEAHKDFFWQLLSGFVPSEAAVHEAALRMELALSPSYHIVVARFAPPASEKLLLQALQHAARIAAIHNNKILLHTFGSHQLILMCAPSVPSSKNQILKLLQNLQDELSEHYSGHFLGLASSRISEQYSQVEEGYREAQLVLQIRRHFRKETLNTFFYSDLGYLRYLPLIREDSRRRGIVNEGLEKLRAYDAEHHSDLLRTLDVFLSLDGNVKTAAEALHIHANTLTYRLKRISEISGSDLASMEQKVTLYLDLRASLLARDTDL